MSCDDEPEQSPDDRITPVFRSIDSFDCQPRKYVEDWVRAKNDGPKSHRPLDELDGPETTLEGADAENFDDSG